MNQQRSRKRKNNRKGLILILSSAALAVIIFGAILIIGKTETGTAFAEENPKILSENVIAENETVEMAAKISETNVQMQVEETAESLPAVTKTMYTTAKVNVRKGPSTDNKVLGQIAADTETGVVSIADNWAKVIYNKSVGYICADYLTEDKNWKENNKKENNKSENSYTNGSAVTLNSAWKYAEFSEIHSGSAVMYKAAANRKNIVVGVNAGHGTSGGGNVKTWCHPDKTPKVTGGTTAAGSTKAVAVSSGMTFNDGTPESKVTLKEAQILKDILLSRGYDVLMIRDGDDVQLDNVARTVICNNAADCHIAIHWDSDGLSSDKGCFYISVPDGIKYLDSVAKTWESSEKLGSSLISGLKARGCKINGAGNMDLDLTQTSYSTVPSVDIELGNQCSDHSEATLTNLANGLADGIDAFYVNR